MQNPQRLTLFFFITITHASRLSRIRSKYIQSKINHQAIEIRVTGLNKSATINNQDGTYTYTVTTELGKQKTITPNELAKLTYNAANQGPWWKSALNVTTSWSLAWVAVGLLGQILFTGRMVVQWLVSEKEKASVIPVSFWWMSLSGASMLIIYFIWRKDVIGVLGQGTGWFIYIRNLVLIYKPRPAGDGDGI